MSGHQAFRAQALHAEEALHDATPVCISSVQEVVADHVLHKGQKAAALKIAMLTARRRSQDCMLYMARQRSLHTFWVRSSTAVAKVCMPPMAVPIRMPHLALSKLSKDSFSRPTPDASSACKLTHSYYIRPEKCFDNRSCCVSRL